MVTSVVMIVSARGWAGVRVVHPVHVRVMIRVVVAMNAREVLRNNAYVSRIHVPELS